MKAGAWAARGAVSAARRRRAGRGVGAENVWRSPRLRDAESPAGLVRRHAQADIQHSSQRTARRALPLVNGGGQRDTSRLQRRDASCFTGGGACVAIRSGQDFSPGGGVGPDDEDCVDQGKEAQPALYLRPCAVALALLPVGWQTFLLSTGVGRQVADLEPRGRRSGRRPLRLEPEFRTCRRGAGTRSRSSAPCSRRRAPSGLGKRRRAT